MMVIDPSFKEEGDADPPPSLPARSISCFEMKLKNWCKKSERLIKTVCVILKWQGGVKNNMLLPPLPPPSFSLSPPATPPPLPLHKNFETQYYEIFPSGVKLFLIRKLWNFSKILFFDLKSLSVKNPTIFIATPPNIRVAPSFLSFCVASH